MKAKLILVVLFLVPAASGTVLINSQDWQEIGKGINYAQLTEEEFMVLNTPGELRVAESTLNSPVKLLQGDQRTVSQVNSSNLMVSERVDIENLAYPNDTNGFLVVTPEFGTDTVSAIPYAAEKGLRIVHWSPEKAIIDQTSEKVLFYGNFEFDPSERFGASEISGGLRERTFKLMERMNSSWAVLSPRQSFNPGALERERPVIFVGGATRTVEAIDNGSVQKLQVLGGSNMLYAKELEIMSDKDLGIVAKLGRAFTGIEGLQGVKDIKRVDIPYRTYNLKVGDLNAVANSSKARVQLINQGSTDRRVRISLSSDGDRSSTRINIPPYTTVSWTTNLSRTGSTRLNVESGDFNYQEVFRNLSMVDQKSYDLELDRWNYSRPYDNLTLRFTNNEENRLWLMVQTDERSKRIGLEPGEKKEMELRYLQDQPSNITVFQGRYRNRLSYSEVIELREEDSTDLGLVFLLLSILLLTFSAFLFIWKGETLSDLFRDTWHRLRELRAQI